MMTKAHWSAEPTAEVVSSNLIVSELVPHHCACPNRIHAHVVRMAMATCHLGVSGLLLMAR